MILYYCVPVGLLPPDQFNYLPVCYTKLLPGGVANQPVARSDLIVVMTRAKATFCAGNSYGDGGITSNIDRRPDHIQNPVHSQN